MNLSGGKSESKYECYQTERCCHQRADLSRLELIRLALALIAQSVADFDKQQKEAGRKQEYQGRRILI
jgi:hypothetical protein